MEKQSIKSQIEKIFPDYLEDLKVLISANSKEAPPEEGAPFGAGVKKALDSMVEIAKKMGLKVTVNPDGYYAYAEIGKGEEMLGILGHLDVVPADDVENWNTPPFEMTVKDGVIYGRGVSDDKGPTLSSLYALKLLLDNGAKLNKRVRFIFCTNEETLWGGVKEYVKKEEHPTYGFTPDADFPLLYSEMGLVEYTLKASEKETGILKGGSALNAVAASAETPYSEEIENAIKKLGYKYEVKDNKLILKGKTAHAMAADKGINAITQLANALVEGNSKGNMLKFIKEKCDNPHGTKIFGEVEDEFSGKLMFNVGLADIKDGEQSLGVDIRFPVTFDKDKTTKALEVAGKDYGISVEEYDYLRPLHVSTDSDLVKSLMKAYQEVTGDTTSKPIATGGATFARSMDNIVAFGALFPGAPKTEHQANESTIVKDVKTSMEVYVRAFELLATEE